MQKNSHLAFLLAIVSNFCRNRVAIFVEFCKFYEHFSKFIFDKNLRLQSCAKDVASRFQFVGVVLARSFFPSFPLWIPKTVQRFQNGAKECIV